MKLYLASPLGFAGSTKGFMRELAELLRAAGFDVYNPFDGGFGPAFAEARAAPPDERTERLHAVNHDVGRVNERAIRAANMVVAVLDGVDVDSGTASEIGFAYALGRPVFGLRTDSRQTGDNAGAIVNLQVQYFIEAGGGRVARTTDELLAVLPSATGGDGQEAP